MRIEAARKDEAGEAFAELERAVQAALETYSNVHRGSGQHAMASTRLFEQAREIVLEHLGLQGRGHAVVFCTPRRAEALQARLAPGSWRAVSSQEFGLALGVRAVAVARTELARASPSDTGGGTARLVGPGWVVWARAPDRFEAGTPAIANVIALATALGLVQQCGPGVFRSAGGAPLTAAEILREDELSGWSGRALLLRLRQTLVGRAALVPTREGERPYVNLDNAASTPTFAPIWTAACRALRQPRTVQEELVREARSICAEALGAPPSAYEVIFTSNTTEAINLLGASLRSEPTEGVEPTILNTVLEHNSSELPWRGSPGLSLVRAPVDDEGFLDLAAVDALLGDHNERGLHGKRRIRLVAVTGASNVLGVCNDLGELARIAHRHGARLFVDAAQLIAHRKVEMEATGIDYLAFSAHKAYAPFGSGALVARKGLLAFGADERARIDASGEENVGGIAALGKALLLLKRIGLDVIEAEERALTERTLRGLARVPGLRVHGTADPDSPRFARRGGVIAFSLRGAMPSRVARELAERCGIGVRSGCHCAHMLVKRMLKTPPAVERLQRLLVTVFPRLELPGVARVSLGLENGQEHVDALLAALDAIARKTRPAGVSQREVRRQIAGFVEAVARRVYGPTRSASRGHLRA